MNTQKAPKPLDEMRNMRINTIHMSAISVEVDLKEIPEESLQVLRKEALKRRVPLSEILAQAALQMAHTITKHKKGATK